MAVASSTRRLPETVVVGCIEYRVTEPEEGFVVFSETHGLALGAFKSRYSFTRDTDGAWSVSIDQGRGLVSHVMGLYRVVEREYGGQAGGHLTGEGRLSGPYNPDIVPGIVARKARLEEEAPDVE